MKRREKKRGGKKFSHEIFIDYKVNEMLKEGKRLERPFPSSFSPVQHFDPGLIKGNYDPFLKL